MECPTRHQAQELYKYFSNYIINAPQSVRDNVAKIKILYKGYKLTFEPRFQNRRLCFHLYHKIHYGAFGVYVPRIIYILYESGHIYNGRTHKLLKIRSKEYRRAYKLFIKVMLKMM